MRDQDATRRPREPEPDIEVTTLRPSWAVRGGRWLGPASLLALAVLLAAILARARVSTDATSAGGGSLSSAGRAPLPVATATPRFPAGAGGAAPTDCASGAARWDALTYYGSEALGNAPVWVASFDGTAARPTVYFDEQYYRAFTSSGWAWHVLLIAQAGTAGTIELRGSDQRRGAALRLGTDTAETTTALTFAAAQPVWSVGRWLEWPAWIFLPGAGCYTLDARWPGGSWRLVFAAGM